MRISPPSTSIRKLNFFPNFEPIKLPVTANKKLTKAITNIASIKFLTEYGINIIPVANASILVATDNISNDFHLVG
jgi:hypothetical protein